MGYSAENIKHLEIKEAIRTRIQVYLGSDDTDGIYQGFKEIINNSTDEALAGYGKEIHIELNEKTNEVSVRDFGRGVPFLKTEDKNVLVSIYTEAHTGGKFDKGAYKNSSGLNGLGGTAVCLSSVFFTVKSFRDGTAAAASFKEGELLEYKEEKTKEKNGTLVTFIPDKKVYKNMSEGYSFDRISREIKIISYLNKGIKFTIKSEDKYAEFFSKNGVADFIQEGISKPLMKKPIIINVKDDNDEMEVAFIWTGSSEEKSYIFVNGLVCNEGGSPVTGVRTALTSSMKKLSGKNLPPELIRKGFTYAINCKVENPSFANQTKTKINNPNLRKLASDAIKEGLEKFSGTSEFNSIVEMLVKFQKAELAADKARDAILSSTKEIENMRKKKSLYLDKLSDAENLGEDSILLLTEGDSAGSTIARARDTKKFGILKLRGKIINPMSNSEEKYMANEEIKLLLYAMGIDINNYNSKKLRYGKIGICVDSDDDGSHIALLIMAVLYTLCPQFLKENRLCWLRSPIKSSKKNGKISYYYSEEEFLKNYKSGEISRYKGLGSLSDDLAEQSMFSKEFQRLEVLEYNEDGIERLIELMGKEVLPRKEFIFNNINFSEYGV